MLAPSKQTPRGCVPTANVVVMFAPYQCSSAILRGFDAAGGAAGGALPLAGIAAAPSALCEDAGMTERTGSNKRKIAE
jgi:hypothetical protein